MKALVSRIARLRSPVHRDSRPLVRGFLVVLSMLVAGCTHDLGNKRARLHIEVLQIPVVYKKQGVIISIDGHKFGPKFSSVVVPAGYHEVHAVFIDCPLPMLVLTCFDNALEEVVPFQAEAGETYILHRGQNSAWIEPLARAERRQALRATLP